VTSSNVPRTALIGCGRWGRNIARVLARIGSLEVIIDPAAEALAPYAEELGVRITSNLDAAFANGIEGVAIAAPAVDHGKLAKRVLEAGKPVFIEKPLALDLDEAQEVAALAQEKGLALMVGHLLQYHPAFVRLAELVAEGAIGELRHVTSHRLNPGAIRTEENALWSMGPHDFSMILRLIGEEPDAVSTLPVRVVNAAIPDQFFVQMSFPSGRTGQANVSWLSPYKEHKLTVLGTEGALVFEDTAGSREEKLMHYPGYVDRSGQAPSFVKGTGTPVAFPEGEPLEMEMRAFLSAAQGKNASRSGPEEAIPVLRLLHNAGAAAITA
jgi:UDP-2-acetamido-3-amino-2,3-dideoxy-glucuronate N-acetyltransferase|tara:strand:- start:3371 stop:4348 length:978 start_codon:yes stop_codon:yes gene_type:complete